MILEYCQVGLRGYVASRILTQHGFRVKNLDGGFKSCLMSPFKLAFVGPVETAEQHVVDPDTQIVKGNVGKKISDCR